MKARFVRVLVVLLASIGLVSGTAVTASAGTADYQYTCSVNGSPGWAMPKGTAFSQCAGGVITERLNGQVTRVINVNGAGYVFNPTPTRQVISCLVSIAGTIATVWTTKGTGSKVLWGSVSGWGLTSCKA